MFIRTVNQPCSHIVGEILTIFTVDENSPPRFSNLYIRIHAYTTIHKYKINVCVCECMYTGIIFLFNKKVKFWSFK